MHMDIGKLVHLHRPPRHNTGLDRENEKVQTSVGTSSQELHSPNRHDAVSSTTGLVLIYSDCLPAKAMALKVNGTSKKSAHVEKD